MSQNTALTIKYNIPLHAKLHTDCCNIEIQNYIGPFRLFFLTRLAFCADDADVAAVSLLFVASSCSDDDEGDGEWAVGDVGVCGGCGASSPSSRARFNNVDFHLKPPPPRALPRVAAADDDDDAASALPASPQLALLRSLDEQSERGERLGGDDDDAPGDAAGDDVIASDDAALSAATIVDAPSLTSSLRACG